MNASHIITLCSWAKFKFTSFVCKWVRLPHTAPMMASHCQTVSVSDLHTVRPRKHSLNSAFPIHVSKKNVLSNCPVSLPDSFPAKFTPPPPWPFQFQSLPTTCTCTLHWGQCSSFEVIICHCAFVVVISCCAYFRAYQQNLITK